MRDAEQDQEDALIARVTERAQEKLNSHVKHLAWVFGLALVVATIGGWISFSKLVQDRIDAEIEETEKPFRELKESTSQALAKSGVDVDRLTLTASELDKKIRTLADDYSQLQNTYKSLDEDVRRLQESKLGEISSQLDAINKLASETTNLIRVRRDLDDLIKRVAIAEQFQQQISGGSLSPRFNEVTLSSYDWWIRTNDGGNELVFGRGANHEDIGILFRIRQDGTVISRGQIR